MSIKTFFAKIGTWVKGLFNSMEKAWDKVSPEVQEAIKQGSAIVAEITTASKEAPEVVYNIIAEIYPELTKDKIAEALAAAANTLNVATDAADSESLHDLISVIQVQLDKGNKDWYKKASSIAGSIAQVFAPTGTKWGVIQLFLEFAYQKFIKKAA